MGTLKNLVGNSRREVMRNRRGKTGYSSKYKGVHYKNGKFCAQISYRGNNIHLGYYDDEIRAAKVYDAAAKNFYGDTAYLNFPKEHDEIYRQIVLIYLRKRTLRKQKQMKKIKNDALRLKDLLSKLKN